jgi:hypothetical protein
MAGAAVAVYIAGLIAGHQGAADDPGRLTCWTSAVATAGACAGWQVPSSVIIAKMIEVIATFFI